MEDIWTRLLDTDGNPISEPLRVNAESLDQANHAIIQTDTGFAIFSVEKGSYNPSIDYAHIAIDPDQTPEKKITLTVSGELTDSAPIAIKVRSHAASSYTDSAIPENWSVRGEFPSALPLYPVDIEGQVVEGVGNIVSVDQPRVWNDYKATIYLERQEPNLDGNTTIELTWGNEVPDGPTPTPTATPTSTPTPPGMVDMLSFKAYIDGSDLVHIQGNRVWYTHLKYTKPGLHDGNNFPTYINGAEWIPSWSNDLSSIYEDLDPLLPEEGTIRLFRHG